MADKEQLMARTSHTTNYFQLAINSAGAASQLSRPPQTISLDHFPH